MKNKFKYLCFIGVVFLASVIFSIPSTTQAETVSGLDLVPDLDISLFSNYLLKADVSGSPNSVSVDITGINGDGDSYWNYYYDGTGDSDTRTKTMTYDSGEGKYISSNIYPDDIYPELYFAPSSITWYNTPASIDLRRNSYHLLHFTNPFTIRATSTIFVEFYATPNSTVNSADLGVYLVAEGKSASFFNSDWRNNASVELIGTLDKNATLDHTHVVGKSSHHVIQISANEDGTVGSKNLDISDDFWIILYSNSPNTARGWSLKYHSSSLCDNTNAWYVGSQSGWTTTAQAGCPDSHLHFARRGVYTDGITTTVTASYDGGVTATATGNFYFETLPNLAPNPTNFIVPVAGGVYDGSSIALSWASSTDANGDDLTYDVYLLDSAGDQIGGAIVASTTQISASFDISSVDNGDYGLKGVVCDEAPLCTEFTLSSNFTINKAATLYSLSGISLTSDNANSSGLAKAGNTVTLTFTASGDISSSLNVDFYSGGSAVVRTVSSSSASNVWTVTYIVDSGDTDGAVDFEITADNLDVPYVDTDDDSTVVIDNTAPSAVSASPSAGNYTGNQTVSLSSSGSSLIRYSVDGTDPTCSTGSLYSSAIAVSSSVTVKAIACDSAGNQSAVGSFSYSITSSASAETISSSQGSVISQVDNLISLGDYKTANLLKQRHPHLFANPATKIMPAKTKLTSAQIREIRIRLLFLLKQLLLIVRS